MFKFVVLCALAAAVVAKPEPAVLLGAPLSPLTYSSIYNPAATTITNYGSSVLPYYGYGYNSPLAYSHFIKKRSAPLAISSYYSPTSYIASNPWASAYTAPLLSGSPFYGSALTYGAPAHFIKKRSVAALPLATSYVSPTTYTTSYAAGAHILPASPYLAASPYVATSPFGYSHFIKKRSAPLITSSYIAPTTYSTAFDLRSSVYPSYAPSLAYSYGSPLAYSYLYKK